MPPIIQCPRCGAPVEHIEHQTGLAVCAYCGTSFVWREPSAAGASPRRRVLLKADFRNADLPGWALLNTEYVHRVVRPQPALRVDVPASDKVYYALRSGGWYDDADIGVDIRFVRGGWKTGRAGLILRHQDGRGSYNVFISIQGTYMMGYYAWDEAEAKATWHMLMGWTKHTALKPGLGTRNRLRVAAYGDRFRIYLNDTLASTLHHGLHNQGQVRLAVEPGEEEALEVLFSNLEVWEERPV